MTTSPNPYRGFRYPAEVIQHAVWLYHCFSLSLRDVELILAARGIVVSYESIREWGLRFGRMFANAPKRRGQGRATNGTWMRCSSAFAASSITSGVQWIRTVSC
jgi:putative transposase